MTEPWLITLWCSLGAFGLGMAYGISLRWRETRMWRNIAVTYCEEYMHLMGHRGWKWPNLNSGNYHPEDDRSHHIVPATAANPFNSHPVGASIAASAGKEE